MRFEHPVFQGPRKVDRATVSKIDEYSKKEIKAWRVQKDLKTPGLVATRRRFVDSPDSEIIAGGTNMKGDRGVPLVREGNIFLWGFSGNPDEMTDAGRAAFVNAVVYIEKFENRIPSRRIGTRERSRWKAILGSPYVKPNRLPAYFGPDLVAIHGEEKEAYQKDLEKREQFLYVPRGTAAFSIDADAEKFGHPTNSLELIKAALKSNDESGRRVLDRYWPEDDLVLPRPKSESELELIKTKIVFSETHGYRWLSKPPVAAPREWEINDAFQVMDLTPPTEFAPAIFGARLVGGYNAKNLAYDKKLGLVTLAVRAKILDQWHVTIKGKKAEVTPVKIEVELPKGLRWHEPEFQLHGETLEQDGVVIGQGELTWTRKIWIRGPAGSYKVSGKIHFTVCDEMGCKPPEIFPFTTSLNVR